MNTLGNKIISPNIMEEQERVEQLKNFLNEYISEEEVYSQIYKKSNTEEIEVNYQVEEKNGKISVSPTIDSEQYKKEFDELKEISTLRDLKRFLIKYQDILIENILEQKSQIQEKYSQEVKEAYENIGDKIRDKLNQENNIEYLKIKLKRYNIILGETIDIKNYKRIIEIAKQDERILELFKINPKFIIKILERLEKEEIDINFVQKIPKYIISSLNEEKLQENIFDFYNDFGIDFLIESSINLNIKKFKKLLKHKILQDFIKINNLDRITKNEGIDYLMWNEIKFQQFLNNILDIKNVSKYISLLEKYNKYSENFINFVLYYPEFIKKTLKSGIEKTDVIQLDPTNPKITYILEKNENVLLYILENKDKLDHLRDFLDGKVKKGFILKKELTKEEFFAENDIEYIKYIINNGKND